MSSSELFEFFLRLTVQGDGTHMKILIILSLCLPFSAIIKVSSEDGGRKTVKRRLTERRWAPILFFLPVCDCRHQYRVPIPGSHHRPRRPAKRTPLLLPRGHSRAGDHQRRQSRVLLLRFDFKRWQQEIWLL